MTKLAVAALFSAVVSSAASITYNVDQTVGAGGVTGTIQTDGTIGTLGQIDITSWNLLLNNGTATFDLTNLNSGVTVFQSDLTATSTQLLFNFDNNDSGYLFFAATNSPFQYWCPQTAGPSCTLQPNSGEDLAVLPGFTDEQFTTYTGKQGVIASVSDPVTTPQDSAVPEPSTFSFLGLGVATLAFWKFRAARFAS